MVDSVAMTAMSPEGEASQAAREPGSITPMMGMSGHVSRRAGSAAAVAVLQAMTSSLMRWPMSLAAAEGNSGHRFLAFGPVGHAGGVSEEQVILAGMRRRMASRTVRPPTPESKRPMGSWSWPHWFRSHQHILCPMPLYRWSVRVRGVPPSAI